MFKGFRDFVLRGNVLDLAVGVIIGGAFGTIIASLVGDVINPLIAGVVGKPDFSAIVLHVGSGVVKVGSFLNAVISFLMVAFAVYFCIVVPANKLTEMSKKPETAAEPTTKICAECLSEIPIGAKRCSHCGQPVA